MDPTVNLDVKVESTLRPDLSGTFYLHHHFLHERLSAEAGIHRHYEEQINLAKEWFHLFKWSLWAQRQTGCRPRGSDIAQCLLNIVRRFDVDRNVARKGKKSRIEMIRPFDHQMGIQGNRGSLRDCLYDARPKGDVVHKVSVHHVEMQPVCAGLFHARALRSKLTKITREHRGGYNYRFAVHRFSFFSLAWCPVPEITYILPGVSWLFFKARTKHPYLNHTGRVSNAEKQPTGPAQRVAMKMGRRPRCSSVTYRFR